MSKKIMPQMVNFNYFIIFGIVIATEALQNELIYETKTFIPKENKEEKSKGLLNKFKEKFTKDKNNIKQKESSVENAVEAFEKVKEKNKNWAQRKWSWFKLFFKGNKNENKKFLNENNCNEPFDKRVIQTNDKNEINGIIFENKNYEKEQKKNNSPTHDKQEARNYKKNVSTTANTTILDQKENPNMLKAAPENISRNSRGISLLTSSFTSPTCQSSCSSSLETSKHHKNEGLSRVSSVDLSSTFNVNEKQIVRNISKSKNFEKTNESAISSPYIVESQKINDIVKLKEVCKYDESVCVNEPFDEKVNLNFHTPEESKNASPPKNISNKSTTTEEKSNTLIIEDKNNLVMFNFNKLSMWTILFVATISFTISFFIVMLFK